MISTFDAISNQTSRMLKIDFLTLQNGHIYSDTRRESIKLNNIKITKAKRAHELSY